MGRVRYDPHQCSQNHKVHYGSGFPVFQGQIRQDGYGLGGLLSGIFRAAVPMLKPIAKGLAKTALKTGGRVLSDVVGGKRSFGDSLRTRVSETMDEKLHAPYQTTPRRKKKRLTRRGRRKVDILD